MPATKNIYWLDVDRLDTKPNRSPWLEMSKVLIKLGHDVSLLTAYGRGKHSVQSHSARILRFSAVDVAGLFRVTLLFRQLLWLLRNAKAEDIIILPPEALVIAPFLNLVGKRNIHLDVRTVPVEITSIEKRVGRWLYWKFTIHFFHKLAVSYSFITERLRLSVEKEFRIHFPHSVIWQSGVSTEKFSQIPRPHPQTETVRDDFALLYHGTISPNRGIDRVIEALAGLDSYYRRRIRFFVVGPGPALPKLMTLATKSGVGDRVVFTGPVSHDRIPGQIACADCCICPLPARPEWHVSSPLKLLEYMAAAKPMILTPINAHKDIADGQDYVVWTKGYDANAFKDAIQYAYDNRSSLLAASLRAPEFVKQHYDWKIQGRKLHDYFRRTFPS